MLPVPVIKLEDISWYEPPHKEAPTPILKGTLKETVKAYEKDLITETLHECGNISKAAEKLGLTRQNLNNKMKEYQLDPAIHLVCVKKNLTRTKNIYTKRNKNLL